RGGGAARAGPGRAAAESGRAVGEVGGGVGGRVTAARLDEAGIVPPRDEPDRTVPDPPGQERADEPEAVLRAERAPDPVGPWHRTWAVRSKWEERSASAVPAASAPPAVSAVPSAARSAASAAPPAGTRAARAPARPGWWSRGVGHALALAAAVAAPLLVSTAAQQSMVNDIGLYALLALGLNVVVGYAGLLDLGYIAFFAIGAYTTAYLSAPDSMPWHAPFQLNPFLAMPVALLAAAVAGILLGGPTLRLRGDYLAIVTLGFGEIVHLLANNADGITGGARGVFGVPPLSVHVGGFHYTFGLDPLPYYYLLLGLVVLVMAVLGVWERSRTGRAWAAIRQDEVAAEATGVRTVRMKLLAFAIGASVSGFAGVILASKQFFNPQTFGLQASLLVLTIVIFGGMGSRLGVVLGAVVLQGLAFFLRDRVPAADRFIYFGALVMIMMVFRPRGLLAPRPRFAGAHPVPAWAAPTAATGVAPSPRSAPARAVPPAGDVPADQREESQEGRAP
ncbi:branched-chain amino acid ABC transporter permease, partial [Frankia nepalensis]|uniref:branched-chain amino acid ABC transporter permease n=1 Tax=Frankia nepalensis TaxID=1836974 RepID=UPI001EE43EAD